MQVVNTITRFFVALFVKTENERRAKGQETLYSNTIKLLADAPPEATEEEKIKVREAYIGMGVLTFSGAALAALPASIKAAGRVLAHLVYPEDAAKMEGKELTPEELKEQAYKALELLTETDKLLKPLIAAATESLDMAHVAEAIWDAGRAADKAGEDVKARPVEGEKKSPWVNRLKPSNN
jgi:hypothetical protein